MLHSTIWYSVLDLNQRPMRYQHIALNQAELTKHNKNEMLDVTRVILYCVLFWRYLRVSLSVTKQ